MLLTFGQINSKISGRWTNLMQEDSSVEKAGSRQLHSLLPLNSLFATFVSCFSAFLFFPLSSTNQSREKNAIRALFHEEDPTIAVGSGNLASKHDYPNQYQWGWSRCAIPRASPNPRRYQGCVNRKNWKTTFSF